MQDDEPAVWAVAQDYVGPDGVARRRDGPRRLAARRAVRDAARCCRTSARTPGPKEGRLRLLRAARAQLEPIFLLYDGEPPVAVPDREPDLAAGDTRLWRFPGDGVAEAFADRQLLIADGHHRYETAARLRRRGGDAGERADDGRARLDLRPRPRDLPDPPPLPRRTRMRSRRSASATRRRREAAVDAARAAAVRPRRTRSAIAGASTFPVVGEPGELDVELVDRLVGHEGLGYTADLDEAVARVDAGEFDGAFLLRATRIEDVFERARRGEVMPQKTTYFFPKLTSGLLFHPV